MLKCFIALIFYFMNWYKNKIFVGNCISGLDDPYFADTVNSDATELSQLVENGKEMSYNQFASLCNLSTDTIKQIEQNPKNYIFYKYYELV